MSRSWNGRKVNPYKKVRFNWTRNPVEQVENNKRRFNKNQRKKEDREIIEEELENESF